MEESMIWLSIAIVTLIIWLIAIGLYIRKIKKEGRPKGADMGEGLAIGMTICVVIGIALSELTGYYYTVVIWIPIGAALGFGIGTYLEKRYQKK